MAKNKDKTRRKKSHIPFRLNLLFFIVFLLFSAIIVRLGYLQIVRGDEFEAIVRRTETTSVTQTVPRGLIYDRNGNVLVGNEAQHAITFTRGTDDTAASMSKTASQLSRMITVDVENLTERDLKDFWAANNREKLLDRLTDKEKLLPGGEVYEVELSKITAQDINYSEEELQAIAIFKRMNGATALTTVNIKNVDVTKEELAIVSENINHLFGIDVAKDWTRVYPHGDLLKTILGEVTSERVGIPSNLVDAYLAKGYSRNDRVGNAYLEQQYETVLRGSKAQLQVITNQDGETVTTKEVYPGKQGDNLILSVDIAFQKELEEIAVNFLKSGADSWNDRVYIVALDPNNGDVLGMTGKRRDIETNEIVDNVHGVLNENFIVGSSMKGATVLAGYMEGVLSLENNTLVDAPITIAGSKPIRSLFNPFGSVPVNDIKALEVSSNIYMAKIAMMMGGLYNYKDGQEIDMNYQQALSKLRYYYSQFGLGVRTGIDLPAESGGFIGDPQQPADALFGSFGQYDNYTPLQLAQYIATIANGGTRYAPRLVKEIRGTDKRGGLGSVEVDKDPKVMNQLNVRKTVMDRIHQGMWQVTHSPTAVASRLYFGENDPIGIAGKTGTGEAVYQGGDKEIKNREPDDKRGFNTTFVAFGPFENPEIAVAVVVPYQQKEEGHATGIAKQALDAYFNVETKKNND